ncbi:tryptophan--tRNA ligase [Saccharomycopsis crataegensis]|uniref:Tryptophan--tRNA ligase, mitochondrial n=1 Tax=Saccharomycopsis crataegensis TaxID=43959 RepID=A0AAV5QN50_9ASCO|nr:tryptophan--tRNA ligase [Saccharomycopsis crataegensis]
MIRRIPVSKTIATGQRRLYSSVKPSDKGTVQTVDYQSNMDIPPNSTMFSLIQPTNRFHIGNYLGTIKIWRDLANNPNVPASGSKLIFGLADLHALTSPKDPKQFKNARLEAVASIIASGIDPKQAILFSQSAIPEHCELYWLLCCLTGMGQLNRMTQWKAKSQVSGSTETSVFEPEVLKKAYAGVFMYPVLQAADILLYRSTHVPVGDDQTQHLELTRTICESFNKTYKNYNFPQPKTILAPTKKVLSLRDPTKKMSKSDPDQNSCIYITEDAKTIQKKIRKAVTDSIDGGYYFDPVNRPGVSNLLNVVSGLQNCHVDEIVKDINDVKKLQNHKELKDYVSEAIIEGLKSCKTTFAQLMEDKSYLEAVIKEGNDQAREIASKNMKQIKTAVGLN